MTDSTLRTSPSTPIGGETGSSSGSQTGLHAALTRRGRKRTKVVATIGPGSTNEECLRAMFHAGMNVARLNMSHGEHADHLERLQLVRRLSKEMERPIAILIDLQGPKIRTGRLAGGQPVEWKKGAKTVITVGDCPEGTAARVGTTYAGLAKDVTAGSIMLVDDGKMRVRVERIEGDDIHCVVLHGGQLKQNKGINLPGVHVSAPSLSDKDKKDLAWGIANDIDYIALSFVRNGRDVKNLKHRIAESGRTIPVIAKIEKPESVENISEILAEADGIMVARGDLGIEISTERLPVVQKSLISAANRMGKLVITATQMLESMIENPIPTRAETSDVANAIFDGTDAIMLSGETATGKYPVEAVSEMLRIAIEAEKSPYMPRLALDSAAETFDRFSMALTGAADLLQRELAANAVLIYSHGPEKALLLSKRRNAVPLIALCYDERTWRRLALFWGIIPLLIPFKEDPNDLLEAGVDEALKHGILKAGETVVVIFGFSSTGANAIKVHHV
ncbi:MAG TPA: pyruvate kinase [Planctomycetota bacterium]|nr:pyruvate kinase [Planctomycetota bacterium]